MCSPVTLYAELEDEQSVSVTCLVERINGTTATVDAGECGVEENKKYSLAVWAVYKFGLSSTSEPVTIVSCSQIVQGFPSLSILL